MRYALFAALLVIAVVRFFPPLQVQNPPDLPPIQHVQAMQSDDEAQPPPSVLSHEIRTSLRMSPSYTAAATQPAASAR